MTLGKQFWELGQVADDRLLEAVRGLVREDRRVNARLLAHLVEVEERRLHLKHAKSSMFEYCLELGMSEDEAGRRLCAARVAKRFPAVYRMLDEGRLSLSAICLLKQYLTIDNHAELLEGVSRMSYRKAELWLAEHFPRPDTPSIIRKFLERSRSKPLGGDRYHVEFTASTRLKEKLELAADLMAHRSPSRDWAPVIEPALDLLISKLHKERFAETDRPARPRRSRPAKSSTVANETRRAVLERDGLQCSYVDDEGRRCTARAFLEFDHRQPRGKGGGSGSDNVRHLCRAHNQWFAELEYGREHIERARDAKRRGARADGAATSRPNRANSDSTAGGGGATDTS